MQIFKKMIHEIKATYEQNPSVNAVKIKSSDDVNDYIRPFFPVDLGHREAMLALYLNRANNTVGYVIVSIGSVAGTVCDPKLIFQHGLLCNASSVILVHNHPSGNLQPSESDIHLTKKVKRIGDLFDMNVLDHLIIDTNGCYFSMADEGFM